MFGAYMFGADNPVRDDQHWDQTRIMFEGAVRRLR
jgi:hypothetical protein